MLLVTSFVKDCFVITVYNNTQPLTNNTETHTASQKAIHPTTHTVTYTVTHITHTATHTVLTLPNGASQMIVAKPRLSSALTQLSLVGCIITVKENK